MKETTAPGPSPDEVKEELQRILTSPLFSAARRQSEFLRFVVTRGIEGQAGDLKESLIGVELYGRDPSYDPKADSIVRAEASRLRAKLREYYDTGGQHDPVRIELPKGSYTPAFRVNTGEAVIEPPSPPEPAVKTKFRWWWAAVVAGAVMLGAIALLWWPIGGSHRVRSIAVMPIRNLGPDRADDSIGDVLADEFTSALVDDSTEWKVAGRAPAVDQTGRDEMLTWLQQNLHADFVLTGSYRVGQNSNVTLSLQLADVQDGHLVWTRTYQQRLAFLAESQKEFVRAIVAEFTAKTSQASARRAARIPANEKARQSYARARELLNTHDEQDLQESLNLFQRTIDADPTFEPAWAGLADANALLKDKLGEPTAKRIEDARAAAIKAIALDDSDGEAHSVMGRVLAEDWKFRTAALELARASELDPIRVFTHIQYSLALSVLGDFAGAQAAVEAARARLPPIPEVLFQQGSVYFLSRQPEKLEQLGRQLIGLEPNGALGHWLVGMALEERGATSGAIVELKRGLAQNPRDLRTLCALSHAYALVGNKAKAFETAGRYIDLHTNTITRYTLCSCAALLYTGMGRKDEAFEWLEKARTGHDNSFPFLLYDWRFDPLKSDPRFKVLADWQRDRMRQ